MKILLCMDSFKGTLTSLEAARCVETGFRKVWPQADYVTLPISDGGEGFTEAMAAIRGGEVTTLPASDPLGRPILASAFFPEPHTAVLDLASASGLTLLKPEERDPLKTTTYGTGEIIRAATERGARTVILGLGGSATNDGGVGLLQALGYSFIDADGHEISRGGGELVNIHSMSGTTIPDAVKQCSFILATDVRNPFIGPEGATFVFSAQKGASASAQQQLEAGMVCLAQVYLDFTSRDIRQLPGTGAAGGVSGALMAVLGAEYRNGLDLLLDYAGFESLLAGADLVVTGEGSFDAQSRFGKVPLGIARRARHATIPVIAINGSVSGDIGWAADEGLAAVVSAVADPSTLDEVLDKAAPALIQAAEQTARLIDLSL